MRPRSRYQRSSSAFALLLLAACQSGGGHRRATPKTATPAFEIAFEIQEESVLAALRALGAALEADDDAQARALVANLRARGVTGRAAEFVASAERVLTGRELVKSLELRLVSEPELVSDNRFRLVLLARSTATNELCLRLPAAELKRARSQMSAAGLEGLDFESQASTALAAVRVPAGGECRVLLLAYELPLGRALGVRERWRLEPRAGEVERAGERFPAANVRIEGCERERRSPLLGTEPSSSAELLRALETSKSRSELLRLALCLPSESRPQALDALAPLVASLAKDSPERVEAAEPALRWLSGNREIGADAEGWARWLAARAKRKHELPAPDRLDLPSPRREEAVR